MSGGGERKGGGEKGEKPLYGYHTFWRGGRGRVGVRKYFVFSFLSFLSFLFDLF